MVLPALPVQGLLAPLVLQGYKVALVLLVPPEQALRDPLEPASPVLRDLKVVLVLPALPVQGLLAPLVLQGCKVALVLLVLPEQALPVPREPASPVLRGLRVVLVLLVLPEQEQLGLRVLQAALVHKVVLVLPVQPAWVPPDLLVPPASPARKVV